MMRFAICKFPKLANSKKPCVTVLPHKATTKLAVNIKDLAAFAGLELLSHNHRHYTARTKE